MTNLENLVLKELQNNARIDLHDLAIMLDVSDIELANTIELRMKHSYQYHYG